MQAPRIRYNVELPNGKLLRLVLPEDATAEDLLSKVREKCSKQTAYSRGIRPKSLDTVVIRRRGVPVDIEKDPIIDGDDILAELIGPNEIPCVLDSAELGTPNDEDTEDEDDEDDEDVEVVDFEDEKDIPLLIPDEVVEDPNEDEDEDEDEEGDIMTLEEVDALLTEFGMPSGGTNPWTRDRYSRCARAAIGLGYFPCKTEDDLDRVVWEGPCENCGQTLTATLRAALEQGDRGGDYEDGAPGGAVQCEECSGGYLSNMCEGNTRLNSGKSHNHCRECDGFGVCMGDYRSSHCHDCGGHYFAGFMGDFPCEHCEAKRMESDPLAAFAQVLGADDEERALMMAYLWATHAFDDMDQPDDGGFGGSGIGGFGNGFPF